MLEWVQGTEMVLTGGVAWYALLCMFIMTAWVLGSVGKSVYRLIAKPTNDPKNAN